MLNFPAGLDVQSFLSDYWQKRPLVFTRGLKSVTELISSDELLALSTKPEVESRLIQTANEHQDFALQHGPFSSNTFTDLHNTSHWTVLVQSVNLWHKEVASILQYFNFIPNWRLDDIMISYATDQGSVGPHIDAYDVFLIQIEGQRRWRVANQTHQATIVETDCGLSLVEDFESQIDCVLSPGDILYLPPNLAHHGISEGSGMTLSVGFRSPSLSQLSMLLTEELLNIDSYYRDPDFATDKVVPGEISQSAMVTATSWLQQSLTDQQIAIAFGKLQTQPKTDPQLLPLDDDPRNYLQNGHKILFDPASRLAWWQFEEQLHLFANGEHAIFSLQIKPLIKQLCCLQAIDLNSLSAYIDLQETNVLLQFLDNTGYLGIEHTTDGTDNI